MDQQALRDIMSGRRKGAAAAMLRAAAWPLSKLYGPLVALRRGLYGAGVFRGRRAGAPVISVGNITTGGTGKTPMVVWVVEQLRGLGRQPAILMRGYKATGGRSDEAEMLWKRTGVPVVADPNRVASAAAAVEAGADVLVLDDGFQHLALKRDLDIVLVDATCPFGYGHVLPRGLLRERPGVLGRADAVVVTRCDLIAPGALEGLCEELRRLAPGASLHRAGHVPSAVVVQAGRHLPASALAGKRVCAFCGIGNPEAFFASLAAAGAEVVGKIAFDDHAEYGPAAMARIATAVGDADVLATTAKDRVKIEQPSALPAPLWTVQVEIGVTEGREELLGKIKAAIEK